MGIKIQINGSGEIHRTWYARLSRNGRKIERSLEIPIRGNVPMTPGGRWDKQAKGDAAFEKSRLEAEKAFARLISSEGNLRQRKRKAETELFALDGSTISKTPLSTLWEKWASIPRDRKLTPGSIQRAKKAFASFASFAATHETKSGARCATLEEITPELANAYFQKLVSSLAWESVKIKFGLLRNAWRRWAKAPGKTNPFEQIILRKGEDNTGRISRVPLTLEEANRLFDVVRAYDNDRAGIHAPIFPLLACVASTGLRLGDACSLKWESINLAPRAKRREGVFGTIELKTSKTGTPVVLPIIEPFASVLVELEKKRDDRDKFVFPRMLERYQNNGTRSGLIREIKPLFALAVASPESKRQEEPVEILEGEEAKRKTPEEVLEAIQNGRFEPKKRERLMKIAKAFFAGIPSKLVAADMGIAKGQVSLYQRDLEKLTGEPFRPGSFGKRKKELEIDRASLIEKTRRERSVGKCAASIYGWHSLRATFVVLAIEAGVPLAYVEKAVGHSTIKMTLQYFNPTGKHAAGILGAKLANLFSKKENLALEEEALPAQAITLEEAPGKAKPTLSLEEQVDALPEEEKKALARRLLGL